MLPHGGQARRYTTEQTTRWEVRSYTGQPVVEIHTLGSPPLLEIVLRSICAAGARLAGPGEFTLRAFLAGRIDLTQAEAVLGVIDAGDRHELEIALGQLAGGLARPLHRLRNKLLDLLAQVEAGFDFADEDLAFITREELDRQLAEAESDAAAILRQVDSRHESSPASEPCWSAGRTPARAASLMRWPATARHWSRTIPARRATISPRNSISTG